MQLIKTLLFSTNISLLIIDYCILLIFLMIFGSVQNDVIIHQQIVVDLIQNV